MSKTTLISALICTLATLALFSWLFSQKPIRKPSRHLAVDNTDNTSTNHVPRRRFDQLAPKATALNNEPVDIVIEPGTLTAPGARQNGPADLIVSTENLNMRAEPSSRSPTLGRYARGARLKHLRDENGWSLVESMEDGQQGWMFKKYLTPGQ